MGAGYGLFSGLSSLAVGRGRGEEKRRELERRRELDERARVREQLERQIIEANLENLALERQKKQRDLDPKPAGRFEYVVNQIPPESAQRIRTAVDRGMTVPAAIEEAERIRDEQAGRERFQFELGARQGADRRPSRTEERASRQEQREGRLRQLQGQMTRWRELKVPNRQIVQMAQAQYPELGAEVYTVLSELERAQERGGGTLGALAEQLGQEGEGGEDNQRQADWDRAAAVLRQRGQDPSKILGPRP